MVPMGSYKKLTFFHCGLNHPGASFDFPVSAPVMRLVSSHPQGATSRCFQLWIPTAPKQKAVLPEGKGLLFLPPDGIFYPLKCLRDFVFMPHASCSTPGALTWGTVKSEAQRPWSSPLSPYSSMRTSPANGLVEVLPSISSGKECVGPQLTAGQSGTLRPPTWLHKGATTSGVSFWWFLWGNCAFLYYFQENIFSK